MIVMVKKKKIFGVELREKFIYEFVCLKDNRKTVVQILWFHL